VRRRRPALRLLPAALAVAFLLAAGPAAAGPPAAGPAAEESRPTVDPSALTPTAPLTGRPPQGSAPDGSTVGGQDLDTRGLVAARGAPPLPGGLAASAWLVADAGSGAVLAARDPHGRYYPASTLKTLTLLTLVPLLDPDTVVVGTVEDEKVEGSRVGLVTGGRYPVRLLFEALILQSGNDAANALARAAGGTEATLRAMNETAERIGAYDTVAGTPSGLDMVGQSTSPYDLALIFRKLVEDPVTAAILRTPIAQVPPVPGRSAGYQIQNENPLLGVYPGNLGGKTGFTDAARHTFVTAAERDGRRLVVSVLDTENVPLRAAEQAALLLDWGFTVPATATPVGRLVEPADLPASATPSSSASARPMTAAAPAASEAAAAPQNPQTSPFVPATLAAGAVVIVTGTLIARRRIVRRAGPSGVAAADRARSPGPPRHSAGPRRPAPAPPAAEAVRRARPARRPGLRRPRPPGE
jgi:D-alanyl-D-alanine carboxypeptidase (penicillin-binding protein 5/6)